MTTQTTKPAELPEALPRYREYMHLRTTGAWSSGVPAWARDYSGCMNDMTAAHAVIEELHAQVKALSAAQAGVPSDAMVDAYLQAQRRAVWEADQFGRPNIGGLHTNTVREACRAGLKAALAAAPQPIPSPATAQPGQEGEREAIIRAAVAAMPYTNPLVADDLLEGHTMHTEADDIVAIWRAARAAPQPASDRTVSHTAQAIPGVQWQCGQQANGFTAAPAAAGTTARGVDALMPS